MDTVCVRTSTRVDLAGSRVWAMVGALRAHAPSNSSPARNTKIKTSQHTRMVNKDGSKHLKQQALASVPERLLGLCRKRHNEAQQLQNVDVISVLGEGCLVVLPRTPDNSGTERATRASALSESAPGAVPGVEGAQRVELEVRQ